MLDLYFISFMLLWNIMIEFNITLNFLKLVHGNFSN